MSWDHKTLWSKSKLYMERALAEDRNGPMFGFWSALALELVARATLAKVHPALLADPSDGGNLLFAFGYQTSARPRSIPSASVLRRCRVIVEGMTDDDVKFCKAVIERRNEELHTGAPAFEGWSTALWLAEFYRVADLLLRFQEHSLDEFLGPEEAVAARTMIASAEKETIARVMKAIALRRAAFQALSKPEQDQALADAGKTLVTTQHARRETCPACMNKRAVVTGELIRVGEARLEAGQILQDEFVLPTRFKCRSCGLELDGHAELAVAKLGGQFSVTEQYEPHEFYGLGYDEVDLYEPDYGND